MKRWDERGGANHPVAAGLIYEGCRSTWSDEGISKASLAATIQPILVHRPQLWCKGCFDWGGKTRVPGGKPSKHSRDQLQLYSHDTQVRESTQGYH